MLDSKANPNDPDYDARYPLHTACAEGHVAIVKMLLAGGAEPKVRDRWGGEPLLDAINENQSQVVRSRLLAVTHF